MDTDGAHCCGAWERGIEGVFFEGNFCFAVRYRSVFVDGLIVCHRRRGHVCRKHLLLMPESASCSVEASQIKRLDADRDIEI